MNLRLATPGIIQMVPDGVYPTATPERTRIAVPANKADDVGRSCPEVEQEPLEGGMKQVNEILDAHATAVRQAELEGKPTPTLPSEVPPWIGVK